MMNLEISFQTAFLPAPFAHAYNLTLKGDKTVHYHFEIEYLDREGLTQEDIEMEGGELDHYLAFEGELPASWKDILFEKLKDIRLKEKQPEHMDYLFIDTGEQSGHPADQENWQYFLQELIQCIYEINEKESPLALSIIMKNGPEEEKHTLKASFRDRKVFIGEEMKAWDFLNEFLLFLENCDFDEQVLTTLPKKSTGVFVDYGDDTIFRISGYNQTKEYAQLMSLFKDKLELN